jgi:HD-GYP domain-containing protein (c-di-GMP phosphodiesterase class II)
VELVGQFAVGLFAAMVAVEHPWAVLLFSVPAYIIRTSLKRQHDLRVRSIHAVESLADLVDLRDPYTAEHSRRVAEIAREIATEMGLDYEEVDLIARAGRVHDLGKTFIDISLLTKPGRLTEEEWSIFEEHPVDGVKILDLFPDFADGRVLVRAHHERIDGQGYPDGLRGSDIPLGARILAVADGFDAMASARPYREALARDVVLSELKRGRGSQWDEEVIDVLLTLIDRRRVRFGNSFGPPRVVDGHVGSAPIPTNS